MLNQLDFFHSSKLMMNQKNNAIILFDGICILCSSAVRFILKNDTKNQFLFASLQSDAANEILLQYAPKKNKMNSIIFIEKDKIYEGSTAALKIGTKLHWKYKWLYIGYLLPLKLRDSIYYWISRNRYKWFGKRDSCFIPAEKEKSKFL